MSSSILKGWDIGWDVNLLSSLSSQPCEDRAAKKSRFLKIAENFDALTHEVEHHWTNIPPEEKKRLKEAACTLLSSFEEKSTEGQAFSFIRFIKRLITDIKSKAYIVFTIVSGEFGSVVVAVFAASRFAHAVMDAWEEEEKAMTKSFLEFVVKNALKNSSNSVVYTVEMDKTLKDLLDGVAVD